MATKKTTTKKSPAGSGRTKTSARGTSSRARTTTRTKEKPISVARQVWALVIIALAIFIGVSLFFDVTGVFGRFLKETLLGLFGAAGYLAPVIMIYCAIVSGVWGNKKGSTLKIVVACCLVVVVSVAVHLFIKTEMPTENIVKSLFIGGQTAKTGGVVGGLLYSGLVKIFGDIGIGLILILLGVIAFVVLSGVTFEEILRAVFPKEVDTDYEDPEADAPFVEAPVKEPEPAPDRTSSFAGALFGRRRPPQVPPELKKEFDIDVKLDENGVPVSTPAPAAEPAPAAPVSHFSPDIDSLFNKNKDLFADKPAEPAPAALEREEPLPVPEHMVEVTKKDIIKAQNEIAQTIEQTAEQEKPEYKYPPVILLNKDAKQGRTDSAEELKLNAQKIVDTLKSFGVETKIVDVAKGPTVTRYELQPSAGVKISKITGLADDIALNLAAMGVRIEAPIPGKAAVGIEVPNKNVSTVYIREIIEAASFRDGKSPLTFALGKNISGECVVGDIAKMPHVLIAGATGSGKSVCLNSLIISILYKSSPEEVKFIMVDPKVVELGAYNGIPHLLIPVVTDPKKAAGALSWALGEMAKRYQLFAEKGVRDLNGYNAIAAGDDETEPLPRIVIIIDELADLMMVSPGEVEDSICRLAQAARAAGMHLVVATQRPSVDVITGIIKANIPSRIAFSVSSQVDSRTILDMGGAEKLLGRGDMLYYPVGAAKPVRLQGCFVHDKEVESVVDFIKKNDTVTYDQTVIDEIELKAAQTKGGHGKGGGADEGGEEDEMLQAAIECVVETGMASVSMLQRRLKLGYARAARIVDEMEARGIVGPYEGSKPRQVLITKLQWQEMTMRKLDEEQ
ncbi:FtsK/SpoIIIE family DNA translocase [Feifania hominis]|uniref:DNA translocase FtsK n=1 Tax=Feifania hominis TaxID=2763660 RepID=A0A926DH25_9FIRM|nr:DNA translocase FtsK [Feifania hominis]MBC8537164.1 DNA translocase FtsK [Feifania hominis]